MKDNNLKIGPEISRRGFLKGAAVAGVSAVIPAEKAPAAVETGNESALGGFQAQKRPWVIPASNVPSWVWAASISAPSRIRLR